MPWCRTCDRFLSPSTVLADGRCPTCHQEVDAGAAKAGTSEPAEASTPLPWHFKVLVGAIALYLGYRAFEGVEWLVRQL